MSNSDVIALSAAIISLCAMAATLWQGVVARAHNRLSVRPLINVTNARVFTPNGVTLKISFRNVGIGPALITDKYFSKNDARISIDEPRMQSEEVIRRIFGDSLHFSYIQHGVLRPGAMLPVGEEHVLLEATFPTLTTDSAKVLDEYSAGYQCVVKYESLYGDKYESSI